MPLPQRAPCTCNHGDSTISDPRKDPAKGTGILTSAGCSKRQISLPDVDQNWSTQQSGYELKFAPCNECSGNAQEALAVRADGTVSDPRAESL